MAASAECILPGTCTKNFFAWPSKTMEEMDSPLATQQYIQQTIRDDCKDVAKIVEVPEGQNLDAWKYEHIRQFCLELNDLFVELEAACTEESCPVMQATSEMQFLCAAHSGPPLECSAISYAAHNLDGAAALLNSEKFFPSRFQIKDNALRKVDQLYRRLYRIFAHAYFHHREIFVQFEGERALCRRYHAALDVFDLRDDWAMIPDSFLDEVASLAPNM